jgi:hypothetical protein
MVASGINQAARANRRLRLSETGGSGQAPPPVQGACPITFVGWQGDGLLIVADLEEFFARIIFRAGERVGDPTAARYFLKWWDDAPRDETRRELLAEVRQELARRRKAGAA